MAAVSSWTWTIQSMQQIPSGNNAGHVVNVNWLLTGTDGSQTASTQGTTQLPVISPNSGFIPYSQLTQDVVIKWVKDFLGVTGVAIYLSTVQDQINKLENPQITPVTTPLPWA
jgi:hypothetical protein